MTQVTQSSRPSEEMNQPQVVQATEVSDGTLESEAGAIEGKVSEIAKESVTEESQVTAKGDGSKKQQGDDSTKDAKAVLITKLLQNAPKEEKMRKQVQRALEDRKYKLENDIKKHQRRREYHLLSIAIMQLRMVVHQLEMLAKASYDQLKNLWLKFIHGVS